MKPNQKIIRLNHFLSSADICARRKADEIIKTQSVTVNNKRVKNPLFKINIKEDVVKISGKIIKLKQQKWYIAFNKPQKVITSMNDPKNRASVADFFKKHKDRIFPVGRLDWNSEGLLLLTNDGEFSTQVFDKKVPKTYIIKIDGYPSPSQINKLKKGVTTEIGKLRAVYIELLRKQISKKSCWLKVILKEGRNRQLHRMFEKIGFQIKILRRTAIGKLKLRALKPGECYFLSALDIKKVFTDPIELNKKHNSKSPVRQKRKTSIKRLNTK